MEPVISRTMPSAVAARKSSSSGSKSPQRQWTTSWRQANGWLGRRAPGSWVPILNGYKVDMERCACAIFITLHKADDVTASVAYEDALLDPTTIQYFTKSRRTLNSASERAMAENRVTLHVFGRRLTRRCPTARVRRCQSSRCC